MDNMIRPNVSVIQRFHCNAVQTINKGVYKNGLAYIPTQSEEFCCAESCFEFYITYCKKRESSNAYYHYIVPDLEVLQSYQALNNSV